LSRQNPTTLSGDEAARDEERSFLHLIKNSPEKLLWLFGTSGSLPRRRLDKEDLEAACKFVLHCWPVLPLTGPKLLALAQRSNFDGPSIQQVSDRTTALTLLARLQAKLCQRLATEFDRQQVPYVLLKGSAARFVAYSDAAQRCGLDIDIGIPRSYLGLAEQVVRALGFVPAQWSPETRHFIPANPILRAIVESRHYELGYYVRSQVIENLGPDVEAAVRRALPMDYLWCLTRDNKPACFVTLDLHHGLCLDIQVDPLVASAYRPAGKHDTPLVPPPEWIAFHLIYKIYWEGSHEYRTGGHQYADLLRILPLCQGEHETALLKLLAHYRLEVAGYYVLRRIESDFRIRLSDTLRSFLSENERAPTNGAPIDLNDLGDMWPKLWGYR
jgi:hypothetical protein